MIRIRQALDGAATVAAWLAGIATVLMMLHVSLDVGMRYFFNAPLTGTVEIVSAYHMTALAFLPLALIARERGHIIVELFTGWMPLRPRTLLDGLAGLVTLVYTTAFAWKAVDIAIRKTGIREAKESGTGFVEIWPARWFVVAGFGLMAAMVVFVVAKDLRAGLTGRIDPGDDDRHGGHGTGEPHVNPGEKLL